MSENTTIECNKYKFVRFPHVSGFIAFDKNNASIGFDDICKEIDLLEKQLNSARELLLSISTHPLYSGWAVVEAQNWLKENQE